MASHQCADFTCEKIPQKSNFLVKIFQHRKLAHFCIMTRDNNCFLTDDTFAVNDNAASGDDDDDDGPLNHST